jgi:N-acetylmuramoyl-L-alanine amidase
LSAFSLLLFALLSQTPPTIDVVYPRVMPGDSLPRIDRVDSNFVFGSVQPPGSRLWINATQVQVRDNGAFIAFLPVDWKSKKYELKAVSSSEETRLTHRFGDKTGGEPLKPPVIDFPRTIELSGSSLRVDPKGAYFIFPPAGIRVQASEWSDGFYRIPIGANRSAWAEAGSAKDVGAGKPQDAVVIWKVELDTTGGLSLFLPMDRRVLIRLEDRSDPDRIILECFDAISHIDRINYLPGSSAIREVVWEQTSDRIVRLEISLSERLWGYRGIWEEKGYRLRIRQAPKISGELNGLRVTVDPGHGGSQDGSIGPTRLAEKNANLMCSEVLSRWLVSLGAEVTNTRDRDTTLSLPARTALAEAFDSDLLISIHHNALPDGVNPFGHFGTSVHYYRPQSRELALAVQRELVTNLELPDEGIYYDNLALVRPTAQPSILIEAAYMMLPEQEARIRTREHAEAIAEAVILGIKAFLNQDQAGK